MVRLVWLVLVHVATDCFIYLFSDHAFSIFLLKTFLLKSLLLFDTIFFSWCLIGLLQFCAFELQICLKKWPHWALKWGKKHSPNASCASSLCLWQLSYPYLTWVKHFNYDQFKCLVRILYNCHLGRDSISPSGQRAPQHPPHPTTQLLALSSATPYMSTRLRTHDLRKPSSLRWNSFVYRWSCQFELLNLGIGWK